MGIQWRLPEAKDMQRDEDDCFPVLLLWQPNAGGDPSVCAAVGYWNEERGQWDIGDTYVAPEDVAFVADIQPPEA